MIRRFIKIGALAVVASMLAACGEHGIPTQSTLSPMGSEHSALQAASSTALGGTTIADSKHWKPIFTTLTPTDVDYSALEEQRERSATIPFFTRTIQSPLDGRKYSYAIVGADPHTSKKTTDISYAPIVVRVHFADGTVLDPTSPGCNDAVSVSDRFFKGPNFVPTPLFSNHVFVGTTQITDGFQRAEFWKLVKNDAYHTMLTTTSAPVVVDIDAPADAFTVDGVCSGTGHRIGAIDIDEYDQSIRGIASKYATTAQDPLVLSYNVFETSGGDCCVLGYHSAFKRSTGTQVYAIGAYNDAGIFSVPIEDIHAWTHEIGELLNDPFGNNATPAWGNVGQVTGCQSNLEVGDPLTGTPFIVNFNNFTYHPQELTFFDWFYRTPSQGTGGAYSFKGTFQTPQGVCT